MNIEIRPARPEDADAATPLVYSSGPAVFSYVFSHRTRVDAQEYLRRTLRKESGEFGYGSHVVAELDGGIVGAGASFSGRESGRHLVAAVRSIFGTYGAVSGMRVVRRGIHAESIVKPPKGDEHCVAHLGVSPDLRGHGIGTRLVEYLLDVGRQKGRNTAILDVSVENPRAEELYKRLGFEVAHEIKSNYQNETAAIPNHRRMERVL